MGCRCLHKGSILLICVLRFSFDGAQSHQASAVPTDCIRESTQVEYVIFRKIARKKISFLEQPFRSVTSLFPPLF